MTFYEIRVEGHLNVRWSEWFDGLEITNLNNGETVLSGHVADQAALHGVLNKVRDLGLPLVALTSVGPGQREPPVRSAQRTGKGDGGTKEERKESSWPNKPTQRASSS